MEIRCDVLIDVSSAPFAFSSERVRLALAGMPRGEVLKVRLRGETAGARIHDIARDAGCDVVCSGRWGCLHECLIRKG